VTTATTASISATTTTTTTTTTDDAAAKLALLRKFSISGRRQFRLRWGRLNQDLMSFCRLKAMTGAECADRHNALRFWSDGVSVANETKAQDVYIAEMRARLARFPTTLEQDEAILAATGASQAGPRLVAATRFRHCKKRILRNHIALIETVRPLMGLLAEQERRDLDPTDPRGLQVHYAKAYLNKLCAMASRGPAERKRVEEEERRERAERDARRAHAARMEQLREQEEQLREQGGGGGLLEEKSRSSGVSRAAGDTAAAGYSTDEEEEGGAYETADEDAKGVAPEGIVLNPYGATGGPGNALRPVAPVAPQVEVSVGVHAQDELLQLKRELAQAQAEHAAARE
jgi:hypothetical protein